MFAEIEWWKEEVTICPVDCQNIRIREYQPLWVIEKHQSDGWKEIGTETTLAKALVCVQQEQEVAERVPAMSLLGDGQVRMDASELKDALDRVIFSASRDDYRPILSSICFRDGGLIVTDGFRLSLANVPALSLPHEILISRKSAAELSRLLPSTGHVEMSITQKKNQLVCHIEDANTHFTCQLIDGRYPDTSSYFCKPRETTVVVETAAFRDLVRRAVLVAGTMVSSKGANLHVSRLDFKLDAAMMHVTCETADRGQSSESLPVTVQGPPAQLALNGLYLQRRWGMPRRAMGASRSRYRMLSIRSCWRVMVGNTS